MLPKRVRTRPVQFQIVPSWWETSFSRGASVVKKMIVKFFGQFLNLFCELGQRWTANVQCISVLSQNS